MRKKLKTFFFKLDLLFAVVFVKYIILWSEGTLRLSGSTQLWKSLSVFAVFFKSVSAVLKSSKFFPSSFDFNIKTS